jgi:hypothetical protein
VDLIDGLHRAIIGGGHRYRPPAGQTVADALRWLETSEGGDERTRGSRAAAAAGVPARTWRRWRAGSNAPSRKGFELLQAAQRRVLSAASRDAGVADRIARRALLAPTREAWLRNKAYVVVDALVRISNRIEPRVLHVWRWSDSESEPPTIPLDGMVGRTLDDWLAGRDVTMQGTFLDPISEHLKQEVEIVEVHEIRFFRTQKEAQIWGRGRR